MTRRSVFATIAATLGIGVTKAAEDTCPYSPGFPADRVEVFTTDPYTYEDCLRRNPTIVINQHFELVDGREIVDRRVEFVEAMRAALAERT